MTESPETNTTDEIDGDTRDGEREREETDVTDGPRAVDFETATAALTDVFHIDSRRGETITDLRTTTTDEGRQLVATVEKSRSTMVSHRLGNAKRTGRRVGGSIAALAVVAVVAYVVITVRRLLSGDDVGEEELTEDDALTD